MLIITSSHGSVYETPQSPLQAILYDFDIDGGQLKPNHRNWLDDKVIRPILKDQLNRNDSFYDIEIEGRASRSGTPEHNLRLSKLRAQAVNQYLSKKLNKTFSRITAYGVGESLSEFDDHTEFPIDRSVCIIVARHHAVKVRHPIVKKVKKLKPLPAKPQKKEFKLRIIGAKSGSFSIPGGPAGLSAGIAESTVWFQICDVQAKESGFYIGTFSGKTLGWGPTFSGDASFKGPWNKFSTMKGVSLKDFAGPAFLDSYGLTYIINSASSTTLGFGKPKSKWSMSLRFMIKDLEAGRTIGAPSLGVTELRGTMKLMYTKEGCKD